MKDYPQPKPPRRASQFFKWYCSHTRSEELLGDLEETFYADIEKGNSLFTAKISFWWNVFRCMRPYALQPKEKIYGTSNNGLVILIRNTTSAIRNFKRQKLYGSLNLLGLTVSFITVMLISIYVDFETSFESFHSKADQVFRVSYEMSNGSDFKAHWARVDVDFVNDLPHEVAGIEQLVRFQNHDQKYIKIGHNKYKEDHIYTTDPHVFDMFDFKLVIGNPDKALLAPKSVVFTQRLAEKYFPDGHALGKEIDILTDGIAKPVTHTVTGVMKDLPDNTHLPVDMLISFIKEEDRTGWAYIYLQLNTEPQSVASQFPAFIQAHTESHGLERNFLLQPIKSIHLHSQLAREIVQNGSMQNVKIFILIGALVLLMGIINFTNLFSAMALSRTKEAGVRKVFGAGRKQLLWLTIQEAIFYSLTAMLIAVASVWLGFPFFEKFSGATFLMDWAQLGFIIFVVCFFTGVIGGLYPSFMVARVKPLQLLGNQGLLGKGNNQSGFSLKNIMLTFQFAISLVLLMSTIMVNDQFRFMNTHNLKTEVNQVLAITRVPDAVASQFHSFKNEISTISGVQLVASCMEVPSREIRDTGPFMVHGLHDNRATAPNFDVQIVDPAFFELMGIKILAGQNMAPSMSPNPRPNRNENFNLQDYLEGQQRAYLINETAMKKLGWQNKEDAIGKRAQWSTSGLTLATGPIVGVVEDYHQESMKNTVDPTVYFFEPVWQKNFLIRLAGNDLPQTITLIENQWSELFPNYPMSYQFLDIMYNRLYNKEKKQLQLLSAASGLTLFIAVLGIVGLLAYSLKMRLKELAVRKVLGANILSLVSVMGKPYLILLLVGGTIAFPIGWTAIDRWLANFAYHTTISPFGFVWPFVVVGLVLSMIIGLQTLRTASCNPTDVLRND